MNKNQPVIGGAKVRSIQYRQ